MRQIFWAHGIRPITSKIWPAGTSIMIGMIGPTRTKIVCTLGPAVGTREKIRALMAAGMNVARLNCSHGDWDQKRQWIEWIRAEESALSPVGILADLQGPKFRIGSIGDGILLTAGESRFVGPEAEIPINQPEILAAMAAGDRLLLGDGEIEFAVEAKVGAQFQIRVITGGYLRSHKGVTLVDKVFAVDAFTAKDAEDAQEAIAAGVDFIALSYVREAIDLDEICALAHPHGIGVCAKIETGEAIAHLDAILAKADLVMVARGDMGLQVDLESVPRHQKDIIHLARAAGKPVITATQMLESMIVNPRPTRAEVTDVFNAILDGTDAIMLSGETATGVYPVECVATMRRIAAQAESFGVAHPVPDFDFNPENDQTDAIALAASRIANLPDVTAIVCTSTSGQTPRLVSKFRPNKPIYCATHRKQTQRQLSVVWGVSAAEMAHPTTTQETVQLAVETFLAHGLLKMDCTVVVTAGTPPGEPGNTNLIELVKVRKVVNA